MTDRPVRSAKARSARLPSPPSLLGGLLGGLLLALCGPALAQYIWIDDKGIKQLSDRPPPPSVPYKRILKAPGKEKPAPPAENEEATAAGEAPAPAKPAPGLAERNADFNKRRADAQLANQKAAEEAARKADQLANCEAARNNQRAIDQGLRISSFDKNGERSFLSDEERAAAAKRNQQVLARCQ